MSNLRSSFNVSSTQPPRNEWIGWSYMENTAYNCARSNGTCKSSRNLYTFRSNLQDRSYLSGSTNKISYKRGWRSNNTIQTGNRYETFSVTFTCFILSVCCTESYGACWNKDVKHASPSTEGFCGIFVGIPQHQKGYLVYVTSTRKVILSYDVMFDKSFSSALSYTSRPYARHC